MPHAFSERLTQGVLLCDGAMGTVLYARGVPLDACFDVLNLNSPRIVQAVHADYIAAGADAIETNTFGANRFKLAIHGLESQVRDINRRGARLARDVRESAGRDVWVLGSIGPLGKYLEPLGTVTADEAREAFAEQTEALLEGGVDAFVVETFSDLAEIALAVEAIRGITDLPVIAQMAFTDEGVTFMGRSPAEVARELRALACTRSAPTARSAPRRCTTCSSAWSRRPAGCRCRSSPTPDCPVASASVSSICRRRPTWPTTRLACWTPVRGWWAAAAGRPPSTSAPCARWWTPTAAEGTARGAPCRWRRASGPSWKRLPCWE